MNANSIILIIAAYLLGSLSFAIILSKLFKLQDPRSYGSKNPGATNVLRSGNKIVALLTLLGDGIKGWAIVFLSIQYASPLGLTEEAICIIAIAVVVGHMFPIFFICAFSPMLTLILFIIWLTLALALRISSVAGIAVSIFAPLLSLYFVPINTYRWPILVISIFVILRHHENIRKLIHKEENKIGEKIR
ncbi:MAG: glycerol-3-phosphate acyltransferase [Haemophilus parainfluenzae]|nr:MAG: glycerol-3-phosphate acyltransferase [Haemophilus parainfluenzae]